MKAKLRLLTTTLAFGAMAVLLRAQELVGEAPEKTDALTKGADKAANTLPEKGFLEQLMSSYTQWDVFKVGWMLATVLFAYGIATIFFKAMLGDRSPTHAAKIGCFLGAIGFIGINLVTFGMILYQTPNWVGWATAGVLVIALFIILNTGRKVKA